MKKKVLIISDHRIRRSPSQRFRYEQYIGFLEQYHFEFTYSPILSQKDDEIFYAKGKFLNKVLIILKSIFIRIKDWKRYNDFDIIFIQREALFIGSTFFERRAFRSNAKVIFDFDDSIWLLDTSPENKKYEFLKNPNKTKSNIKHAHLVIAGNKYLLDYAKKYNPNSILIPTTINCDIHNIKKEYRSNEKVVIGWSGSLSTVKHFNKFVPTLIKLYQKYSGKIAFKVIGDENYYQKDLNIKGEAWSEQQEVEQLNKMDIGIMPLPPDEWTKGKCGLKGLSYMACGVATIMSNVGVNATIIENGINGYLADTEEDWLNYLSLLVEDKELRIKLGEAGRETVVKHYSVEANKEKYLKAFNSLT